MLKCFLQPAERNENVNIPIIFIIFINNIHLFHFFYNITIFVQFLSIVKFRWYFVIAFKPLIVISKVFGYLITNCLLCAIVVACCPASMRRQQTLSDIEPSWNSCLNSFFFPKNYKRLILKIAAHFYVSLTFLDSHFSKCYIFYGCKPTNSLNVLHFCWQNFEFKLTLEPKCNM